jgi:hypothetical protein
MLVFENAMNQGIIDGSKKTQVDRRQTKEKIQIRDQKEIPGPGQKAKTSQAASKNSGRQGLQRLSHSG